MSGYLFSLSRNRHNPMGQLGHPGESRLGRDDQIEVEMSKIKHAIRSGASEHDIMELIMEAQMPEDFLGLTGSVSMTMKAAFANNKKADSSYFWRLFEKTQRACDDFFNGNFYIRAWVCARTLRDSGMADDVLEMIVPELSLLRNGKWCLVAWSWYVCERVENSLGPGSCTSLTYLNTEAILHDQHFTSVIESIFDDESRLRHWLLRD